MLYVSELNISYLFTHPAPLLGGSLAKAYLDSAAIPTMIILDLTCAACSSHKLSQQVVTMAENRLPTQFRSGTNWSGSLATQIHEEYERSSKTMQGSCISMYKPSGGFGYAEFLTRIAQLLASGSKLDMGDPSLSLYERGVTKMLTTAMLPLSDASVSHLITFNTQLEKDLKRCRKAILDLGICPADVQKSQGAPSKSFALTNDTPAMRIAMKHVFSSFKHQLPPDGLLPLLTG